jgi:hypothetical protein
MPWIRNIEYEWADPDPGTAAFQGFLGWRLEMTAT